MERVTRNSKRINLRISLIEGDSLRAKYVDVIFSQRLTSSSFQLLVVCFFIKDTSIKLVYLIRGSSTILNWQGSFYDVNITYIVDNVNNVLNIK